jgi:hypothetical protein
MLELNRIDALPLEVQTVPVVDPATEVLGDFFEKLRRIV